MLTDHHPQRMLGLKPTGDLARGFLVNDRVRDCHGFPPFSLKWHLCNKRLLGGSSYRCQTAKTDQTLQTVQTRQTVRAGQTVLAIMVECRLTERLNCRASALRPRCARGST